ncbi:hypothetical protein IEQ34_004284 [Dendrobium chrysotoxum]|uniref:LON peptidase N-terminal domain and RING finger protein n=1 Tax=Dendrobium chrysotoxum TaxID=161865 RepID=A0AAV7HEN1_DENCH|nr:hypothetical protein IEQ34_004284 [Dendrobium chrysotoxum]
MAEPSGRSLADDEYDNPEEFQWKDADVSSSTAETSVSAQVLDLMRRGNRAFREKRIEEAISCYSKAQLLKPGDPVILSNRSAAFSRISQLLRERSATASEYQPLNGLDPTTHAELALKDADKVISIQSNSPKPYLLKAKALISDDCKILKNFEFVCDFMKIVSTLFVSFSHHAKNSLQNLDKVISGSAKRVKQWKPQRTDDFECTLCLKLLFEPVTTPCGHSFCRSCLLQTMDHGKLRTNLLYGKIVLDPLCGKTVFLSLSSSMFYEMIGNKCPMCRMVLFISPRTYPISMSITVAFAVVEFLISVFFVISSSVTLNNIIQKNFPDEYAERKLEHANLTYGGTDILPLFVMDVVLPCQKLSLNIFEPRYRLMVRRIMEGNHRMGMVIIDSTTGAIADYACEVEILECEPLPDGRFYLEVEGRRRFHILRSWDQDGYRVAEVEWVQDVLPSEGSQEREDLHQMASEASELAQTWIRNAREAARIGRRARRLEVLQADGVPGARDPEKFSFWLVNLLNLRPSERLNLLRLRDTRERIACGLDFLRRTEEQGCLVQPVLLSNFLFTISLMQLDGEEKLRNYMYVLNVSLH